MRKLLPDLITGNSHELALETPLAFVDVVELERSLAIGTREALSISGALYRGELLEGFALRERTFDTWLRAERGRLRNLTIRGLTQLVELHTGAGDSPAALEACTRLLQLDPLREQAHRSAMRLHMDAGDRASAIAHYRKLVTLLRTELGSEPDAETQQLHAELAAGPVRDRGSLPSRRLSAVTAPPEVQGIARRDVLAALHDARGRALTGSAKVFVVWGEAGVGKTHLCDQLARELEPTGAQLLRARCFESEQVLPYALWSNLLSAAELESPAGGAHPNDVQTVFRALDQRLACIADRFLLRFAGRARRGHALGEALTALEQALSDSAALPDAERAQACVEIAIDMAFCFAFLGRARELVTLLTKHAGELQRLTRSEFVPQYHFWWAFGLTVLGDTLAAEQHARFSLEHATARGDCRGIGFSHGILSYLCWLHGRWIEGVQHGTKAMELGAHEFEIPEAPVLAAVNTHMNYLWSGDWQAALAAVRQAAASADRADSQRGRAIAAFAESLVYSHIERWEPALEAAQRALEASNTPLTRAHALWVLARAQIGTGEPKPALAVLEPMLAQLDPAPHLRVPLLTTLAEARLCDGDASSAQRMAAEALAGARSVSYPLPQGAALRVHGAADLAMGRLASARIHLEAAVSTFEDSAAPIEQARARLYLELNLALQDREAALSQLRRAGALFREHSVEQGVRRVSERMAQLSDA